MIKYYKRESESELGEGVIYLSVDTNLDEVISQVECYKDQFFWSNNDEQSDSRFMLADQPASEIGLTDEYLVDEAEFKNIWTQATV